MPRLIPQFMPHVTLQCGIVLISLISMVLQGCSSIAKGVTEAVLEQDGAEYQRQCHVYGPAFDGLNKAWSNQGPYEDRQLRLLVIHGAGDYPSGYSDAMGIELAQRMGMTRIDARPRKVALNRVITPSYSAEQGMPHGVLHVSRFRNAQDNRELLIFELSWAEIAEKDKKTLAFDESTALTSRRVGLNRQLKAMINMHASDPMIYMGPTGQRIRNSVDAAFCLLTHSSWNSLAQSGPMHCAHDSNVSRAIPSRFAVITHSMGSRIAIDVLQQAAEESSRHNAFDPVFKNKSLNIYMLSNQLQLFQLGRAAPDSQMQTARYCQPDDPLFDQRLMKQLRLISITDPNDVFSYIVPQSFVDEFIDARLCPELINVVTEVAAPISVFGLTSVAEPMTAHKTYFTDSKVLDVIVNGLNGAFSSDTRHESCTWSDVVQ